MAPRARPTGLQVHLQVCLQRPRSCTGENPGRRFSTCAFPCLSFPPTIHVTSLTIVSLLSGCAIQVIRLNRVSFWEQVRVFLLKMNMQVQQLEQQGADASVQRQFAQFLLDVGKGKAPTPDIAGVECLRLPSEMCLQPATGTCQASFTACTASSAGRTRSGLSAGRSWPAATMGLTSCMQLWQRNFPGQQFVSLSADRAEGEATKVGPVDQPVELLNTITPSGIPTHKLLLKLGMPIMLYRNMTGIRVR